MDFWRTKVVVQVVMPNDHSKQDQHNQRKQLEWCDHTDANKEDQVYYDSNSDDDTATQVENVSENTYVDNNCVLGKQTNSNSDDDNENDDGNGNVNDDGQVGYNSDEDFLGTEEDKSLVFDEDIGDGDREVTDAAEKSSQSY